MKAAAVLLGLATPSLAQESVAEFYSGKTVEFYVGYAPGGGYDQSSRLVAQFLGKYLPGNPNVIVVNKPGAGSMTLANELFTTMPKDGTAIGMFGNSLHIWQLLEFPNIRFSAPDFAWIGRVGDADDVMAVRKDTNVASLEQAREREISIGVPGPNTAASLMVTAANNILGTKFKQVSGYAGGEEIRLAVEQGEVEGTQSVLWSLDRPWIEENNLTVLYRVASAELDGLSGVPTLVQLARNDEERQLLTFFSSYTDIGRAVAAPPGVPEDRVAALRDAFMKTVADPEFLALVKTANLRLTPIAGAEVQKTFADLFTMSPELKERAKAATKAPAPQ